MAPSAVEISPTFYKFNNNRDGLALEQTSDDIDAVNVLKAKMKKEKDIYAQSEFDAEKDKMQFRQYEEACDRVKGLYREQHEKQTVAYNLKARNAFCSKTRAEMTVWEAIEKLNGLIDESDPDTSLSQIEHLLQTAEAIRRDGKPRWMQLTGLIHDLGKLLFFFGAEGQWDVVGDTFPVGCAFDKRIIYPDTFKGNPDYYDSIYSTEHGIYMPGCGLDNVMLSWGHDEYLYHICKTQSTLPNEGLAMIRYHSFYPWHSAGAYRWMMNEHDYNMLEAVKAFNPYDLYSKSDDPPRAEELKVNFAPLSLARRYMINLNRVTIWSLLMSTFPARSSSGSVLCK
jgi:inositol oxygenase